MTTPEHRLSRNRYPASKPQPSGKRPVPLGTDPVATVPTDQGDPVLLTSWDVWFALVAARDCDGDLDRLAQRLGAENTVQSLGRGSAERKQKPYP